MNDQRFPRRSVYSSSTKRILAVIIPIASFVVLTGIVILVVLYYKKFRKEQTRTRKPSGAIRLEDNYSSKKSFKIQISTDFDFLLVVPQDLPVDKVSYVSDEQ